MTVLILTVSLLLPGIGPTEPVTLRFERPSMERCLSDGLWCSEPSGTSTAPARS